MDSSVADSVAVTDSHSGLETSLERLREADTGIEFATEPAVKESLQIARAMGWASLGLAAASAVAPHALARALGYGDRTAIVQLLGLRDLVVGAGLITANDPVPWVRARFACEVFDFALHSAGAITGAIDRPKATAIALSAAAIAASELVFFHDAIAGRPEGSTGPDSFTPMPSEP